MKTAKFEVLGLEIPIRRYQEYNDDGYVCDVLAKSQELNVFYTGERIASPCVRLIIADGLAVPHSSGIWPFNVKHVHIFYKRYDSEPGQSFIRAHEETHALDLLGRMDTLEYAIERDFGLKMELRELGKELRANVGAVYALLSRGFSFEQIMDARPDLQEESLHILGMQ